MKPLIFVLSPGSDPVAEFLAFAQGRKPESISLGKGQGSKAEKLLRAAMVSGTWVMLQNCHLALTRMPELEKLVSETSESTHNEYRLWLTSMPSTQFPASVL